MNKIIIFAICAIMAFSNGAKVSAAIYYVDQNHGSANDSNAGTSESLPWLTLGKAVTTVTAGDTVIVKTGTYTDTTASSSSMRSFNLSNSGSNGSPITFRSKPALAAKIGRHTTDGPAWGIENYSYIVIDGFRVFGAIGFNGGSNNTIKNCEVTGGSLMWGSNSLHWGIYLQGSTDNLVQNNYVHSFDEIGQLATSGLHNDGGIMINGSATGAATDNIIEYNTVDDDGTNYMYNCYGTKGGNQDRTIWRYNFGTGCYTGFIGMGSTDGDTDANELVWHHNIIVNANYFAELYKLSIDFQVYNNTAYNCDYFTYVVNSNSSGLELWNNLAISTNKNFIRWNDYQTEGQIPSRLIDYSDYNIDVSSIWYMRAKSPNVFYTHAKWISNTPFGDNSSNSVPSVLNAGGTDPEDYKRVSYSSDGRGGAYEDVVGAYITGNEVIGYNKTEGTVENKSPDAPMDFGIDINNGP